ncbi:hypothetical protein ACS3YM_06595 [Nocardia sp. N13]|uniref:hypothetical protein n=1 Tax=Nocardioides sp. N13(2025) TaxID=3453405 RepID=UPI003F75BFE9
MLVGLLAACSGGGGEDDKPASASYGIETLVPGVVKAVGGEDYVHLSMGDQRGRGEVQVDLSRADPPQFRAITLGEDDSFDAGASPVLLALDVPGDYEALLDAVDKVENKGQEEMSGVSSTHYLVTVDSQAWREQLPEHSVHRQVEVDDTLLVDLWLDEESLPVRLEYDGTGNDDVRIDYSAWGRPISIPAPPDAKPVGTRSS